MRQNNQRGSAYLAVMFIVVVMSIGMMAAAKQWKSVIQREKEADLLVRGLEIQSALKNYSARERMRGVVQREIYPLTLEELTKGPKPLLRKVYKDPMTGEDWEYIREAETGRIRGVHSRAKLVTIKQHQFPPAVAHFEGLTHYNEWVFQHPSLSTVTAPQPVAGQPTTEPPQTQSTPSSTMTSPPGPPLQ